MTPAAPSPLQAVLFDMDGLFVDTEPQWFAAETAVVERLGGVWTVADQHALLGSNLEYAADYMLRLTGVDLAPTTVMTWLRDEMTRQLRREVTLRPGVRALLAELAAAQVPLAMVTSSVREHVDVVFTHLAADPFHVVVTAEDVRHRKPHPEPYLTALAALGVTAAAAVVLEDSPTGVAAAEAAGCAVVAVPSIAPILPAPGRHVTASLEQVDLALLYSVVTARSTSSRPAR